MKNPLFDIARKTQEAHCVRHGIAIERHFTDEQLAESNSVLAEVEAELYGRAPIEELVGKLSPSELALLDEIKTKPLIPFRVTVTVPSMPPEQIGLIAAHACDAVTKAMGIMFPDFDTEKPVGALSIKVEPLALTTLARRAA